MGKNKATILNIDPDGYVELPQQFKVKLKLSRKVFVSVISDGNGGCHLMTVNRNIGNSKNLRNEKTNRFLEFNFSNGKIPVAKFISDPLSDEVVVWFNDETKELRFQCVFSY